MEVKNLGFSSRQIHAGKQKNSAGALSTPIYQTSTFEFESVEQGGARFAGEQSGFIYTRLGNPTTAELEARVASLEGGEACVAMSSGMGAISSVIWSALEAGDQLIADDTLYGCTFALFTHGLPRFGVETSLIDLSDLDAFRSALTPRTRVVYLETLCNPTMKAVDIKAVANIAHDYDPSIIVIVDNTFASPYLVRPLELGADVVVHSATKYLNGHGDVIAGFAVGNTEFMSRVRMFGLKDMTGAVLGPFESFLIIRGLKTLSIRMEKHSANAVKVAEFLEQHPAVKKVYYPGLKSFEYHDVAEKEMLLPGGMMSFELKADRDASAAAINKLKFVTIAVSLGDAETLVEHPASMTHSTYTAEELEAAHIPQGLVRMSVGLEDAEDIIADLKSALDTLI